MEKIFKTINEQVEILIKKLKIIDENEKKQCHSLVLFQSKKMEN